MTQLLSSSVGRKFTMALSALFLMIFLLQHMVINMLSIISPDAFNETSHFMGTNPLIQFVIQPILMIGVVYHFIMGFYLEYKNSKARSVKYSYNKPGQNSSWVSRNMIYTGIVILAFLIFHFADFFFPEINHKICNGFDAEVSTRYYEELLHLFSYPLRVIAYIIAFIFLGLHLNHGFQSAFQSVGASHSKYTAVLKKIGTLYSILVPLGFIIVALVLYVFKIH